MDDGFCKMKRCIHFFIDIKKKTPTKVIYEKQLIVGRYCTLVQVNYRKMHFISYTFSKMETAAHLCLAHVQWNKIKITKQMIWLIFGHGVDLITSSALFVLRFITITYCHI